MLNALLPLHLWDLRAQVESQLRRIVDAQQLWNASLEPDNMRQIVTCLNAVLDANTAVRETCLDARVTAVSLSEPR